MSDHLAQWLPGIAFVAVLMFPAHFFMRQSFIIRLFVAIVSTFAGLSLFGLMLGHEFHFTQLDDLPPLAMGLVVGILLGEGARLVRRGVARARAS